MTHTRSGITGRIALVTGASGGIGRSIGSSLAASGATVAALDIDTDNAPAETARAFGVDVRDADGIASVVDEIERDLGPIDLLVNAAGVLHARQAVETTAEDWDRVFAINTRGVFTVSRLVAARMIPRRRGAIVTVSSNAGAVPRHGMAAYGASKAAATMFTRTLGLELAEHGIRCNVVSPGSTRTPMLTALGSDEQVAIAGSPSAFKTGIPLGRIADPGDIASVVVFLLSDDARHVTMAEWIVDGGASQR